MHYLYFVKIKDAKNSQDAKRKAIQELDNQNFANDNAGYFGSGKADWYVIGGRWSGHLSKITMKGWKEASNKLFTGDYIARGEIEANEKELEKIWKSCGGKDKNPYSRNSYKNDGYPDDAMKLTKPLLKALQATHSDKTELGDMVEVYDVKLGHEITVKDLTNEDIGSFIVVIDYHM